MAYKMVNPQNEIQTMNEQPKIEIKKQKERFEVVAKLPMQEVREAVDKDGTIIHFVTIEEYLTEQANAGA
jgi:hypothetical protein